MTLNDVTGKCVRVFLKVTLFLEQTTLVYVPCFYVSSAGLLLRHGDSISENKILEFEGEVLRFVVLIAFIISGLIAYWTANRIDKLITTHRLASFALVLCGLYVCSLWWIWFFKVDGSLYRAAGITI
jgi:hypothetical protein